jgi:hypothetical protein
MTLLQEVLLSTAVRSGAVPGRIDVNCASRKSAAARVLRIRCCTGVHRLTCRGIRAAEH